MKKPLTLSITATVCASALLFACTVPAQDAGQVETMFRDGIVVETRPLSVPADGVLTAPLFTIRYSLFPDPANEPTFRGVTAGDHVVWVKDGKLVPIHGLAYLSTDDPLDSMDGLIDPSFRLDQESAGDFMAVLQTVMGEDQFDPVPVETIQNDGDTWYFINGDFLSYYKGFVVSVDGEGSITNIDFELSMLDQDD